MGSLGQSCQLRYTDTWLRERIAYQIHIRYGYVADTRSIRIGKVSHFFIIFANFEYVSRYVSLYWIRPSPNKTVCPRCPSPQCPHLTRSHRLQRTHARTPHPVVPARQSPATSIRPRLQASGDECPPRSLETSLRPSPREQPPPPVYTCAGSSVHVRRLLHRGCATARRLSSPSLRHLHAINRLLFLLQTAAQGSTHQSATVAASSRDAGDADERMIRFSSNASCLLYFCMYMPFPILDLFYFCSS
jgi:hypothetical protein